MAGQAGFLLCVLRAPCLFARQICGKILFWFWLVQVRKRHSKGISTQAPGAQMKLLRTSATCVQTASIYLFGNIASNTS